jgi:hypothetical protein
MRYNFAFCVKVSNIQFAQQSFENCTQNISQKLLYFGSQKCVFGVTLPKGSSLSLEPARAKWNVKLQGHRARGQSARARSSQMDFEASSFLDSSAVRSSLRQMQSFISRPPLYKPIRSSSLKPNTHLSVKITMLEANPLEPTQAYCISNCTNSAQELASEPLENHLNLKWSEDLGQHRKKLIPHRFH